MRKDPENRIVEELVRRLAKERETRGLSKSRVAEESGLHRRAIQFIEEHERNPTLHSLLRIGSVLNVDIGPIIAELETKFRGRCS